MKPAYLLCLAFLLTGCDGNIATPTVRLAGKWVNVDAKSDTLSFERYGDMEVVVVLWEREIQNGVSLPKSGSGPYSYQIIAGDTIALQWLVSSSINLNRYYFKKTGDKLSIGKFYEASSSTTILTFKKLR